MDGINLVNTGLAAAALTASARLLEALIKKSSLFKGRTIDHSEAQSLAGRLRVVESRLNEMSDKTLRDDILYRITQLEVSARRHGWDVSAQVIGGGSD